MSLAMPGIPPEVIPFGIITNICTEEPKNADVRTISVSLKNFPKRVFGDLIIVSLCLRIPIYLVTVASEWSYREINLKVEAQLAVFIIYREHGDA